MFVWYMVLIALCMLWWVGVDALGTYDLLYLRFIVSVGEPLDVEVVDWVCCILGLPIHDIWW